MIPWEEFLQLSQSRNKLNSDPLTWAGFASASNLTASPLLGHDSFSVIHGLGYPNDKIAQLLSTGVLIQKTKTLSS